MLAIDNCGGRDFGYKQVKEVLSILRKADNESEKQKCRAVEFRMARTGKGVDDNNH